MRAKETIAAGRILVQKEFKKPTFESLFVNIIYEL